MNKVIKLLRFEAEELDIDIKKVGTEGKGTPQEIADRREALIRTFLEKYYPYPYRVVKGQICDSFGNESCSVDNVILNPIHPYTVDAKTNCASVILADGVDFAIECKSNLASEEEISRVLEQCLTVKSLKKVTTGVWGKKTEEKDYHIPYIIWSNNSYSNIEMLLSKIADYYEKKSIKQLHQFDIIVIDNKYIIYNIGSNSLGGDKKLVKGYYYIESGKDTLALLLWSMSNFIAASPSVKNIIGYYTLIEKDLHYNEDVNKKINNIENVDL